MSESEELREQAVEAVRDEISGWNIGSGYYQTSIGIDEASELAPVVVDTVLRFIADYLDDAAEDIRSMIPEGEK